MNRIDYSTNWQRLHINAITSAYGKSPYFSFYSEEILQILNQKHDKLLELNSKITNQILRILKQKKSIKNTTSFTKELPKDILDLRYSIHPKIPVNIIIFKPYIQTFSDRFKFFPNLSILDLIFNLGPESISYLK